MNTCPTCGQPTYNPEPIALIYPTDSIMVDGKVMRLTRSEMIIAEMLYGAMSRSPLHRDDLLNAIYLLRADEPKFAQENLKVFIYRLRRKLDGTNLSLHSYRPHRYGFVYEAREAA